MDVIIPIRYLHIAVHCLPPGDVHCHVAVLADIQNHTSVLAYAHSCAQMVLLNKDVYSNSEGYQSSGRTNMT